jgi:hypothetical protein
MMNLRYLKPELKNFLRGKNRALGCATINEQPSLLSRYFGMCRDGGNVSECSALFLENNITSKEICKLELT